MRNRRCEQIVLASARSLRLIRAQTLNLTRDNQVFVSAQRDAVLGCETLRAFSDEIDVRALRQDLARGTHWISQPFHAAHYASAQSGSIHDERVELHFAVAVEEAATAGVEGLVIFHNDDCFLDRIDG